MEPQAGDGARNAGSVFSGRLDPNVEILHGTGLAMKRNGMAADNDVPHPMLVQETE
ncbi:MAG TPA: hypothetical protein VH040_02975 [Usitatibacter sp.]|nr:hypothetical protein [Usitatibacter sp.]